MARPPDHKCKRRVGSVTGTWRTTRVCFLRLNRSQEMLDKKRRGGSRQEGRPVRGDHKRKDRPVTPENVPPHRNTTEDPPAVRPRRAPITSNSWRCFGDH